NRTPAPISPLGARVLALGSLRAPCVVGTVGSALDSAPAVTSRAMQPPSGTVTFLFTDIEGSTHLWEERPDAMRVWVAEHDALMRSSVAAHGGSVFARGGDGL